jgi:alkylation response protein AidB-like acyl-CoA dehydrogenase
MRTDGETSELEQYRGSVRQWLQSADVPDVPLDLASKFAVLRAWQRTLYDAGWLGISWSRESGGQGLTALHHMTFSEELARARAPQPIGLIGLDVVGGSIDTFGSSWQRKELLPRLLSGEHIWCQGFSEPGSGSDLASLSTHARRDGDNYVITGQKVWTSWGHLAQWCALLVRTDRAAQKHKGISYVLVDMTSPGITARPLAQMTGDTEFSEVFFEEVRVPVRNLVGKENEGWKIAQDTLGRERGTYTLRRRVEFEVAVDDAAAQIRGHASSADASPQACRAIGRASIAVRGLEAQTRKTIERTVEGVGPSPYDSVDKLSVNEVEQRIFGEFVDVLGAYRNVLTSGPSGLDTERWVKDHLYSRAASIYGGTSEIQKNIIAERLLGLPLG